MTVVKTAVLRLLALRNAARRAVFLGRLRVDAALKRARVELRVAPDLELGRRVRVQLQPGSRNWVTIGPRCRILDDVLIVLKGAELYFGERVEIRRQTVLNLSGRFTCVGRNILSYANVVHCASSITLDLYASTNEFVSIIDSTHHHDGTNEFFYENVTAAPIVVGRNTWICNKASILMGVRVGHNAVIASHAVVNRDVPDGTVVGGLPAKVLGARPVAGPALGFFDELPAHLSGDGQGARSETRDFA